MGKRAGGQPAKAVAKPKLAPATAPAATGGATGAAFGTHQGAALSIMSPTAHPSQFLVNAQHWADVEKAWQAIVDHQVFCGIITEVPQGSRMQALRRSHRLTFNSRLPARHPTPVELLTFGRHLFSPPHRACRCGPSNNARTCCTVCEMPSHVKPY